MEEILFTAAWISLAWVLIGAVIVGRIEKRMAIKMEEELTVRTEKIKQEESQLSRKYQLSAKAWEFRSITLQERLYRSHQRGENGKILPIGTSPEYEKGEIRLRAINLNNMEDISIFSVINNPLDTLEGRIGANIEKIAISEGLMPNELVCVAYTDKN